MHLQAPAAQIHGPLAHNGDLTGKHRPGGNVELRDANGWLLSNKPALAPAPRYEDPTV